MHNHEVFGQGKVPSSWKIKNISDIGDVTTGTTPSTSVSAYYGGEFLFVKPSDLDDSIYIYDTETKLTKLGFEQTRRLPKKTVLVTCIGSIGKMGIAEKDLATNQQINSIIPSEEIISEYLFYNLKLRKSFLDSYANRSLLPIINKTDFGKIHIPIPPLVEQRGIVEVLGTVDECIRMTDTGIEKAEELKLGLMQQLLTRGIGHTEYKETLLGIMPKTWKIMSLGDPSISKIIMGQSPPSSSYNSKGDGLPFLQGNAEFGYKFPKTILYTTKPQKIAQENDILVSVRAPVGELNYAPYRLCIGRGLSTIRVNPKNLSNDFIYYYLKQNINRLHALSTGSTFKAIRKEELFSFKLPIPKIVEQLHINKLLNNINDIILHEKEKQQYFIKLKRGLMQLLLSGKPRIELREDGLHRIE